jgi:hypothetical protein
MSSTTYPQPAFAPAGRSPSRRVIGVILATLSAVALLGGAALLAVHVAERDSDGYFTSSATRVSTDGYAITSDELDLAGLDTGVAAVTDLIGKVRLSATERSGKPVFVGIAPQSSVDSYLGEVARREVTDVSGDGDVTSLRHAGGAPSGRPADQSFWQASSAGDGKHSAEWDAEEGRWAMVVMNADGTAGIDADVRVGARTRLLVWLGGAFLIAGLLTAIAAAATLMTGRRKPRTGVR